MLASCASDQKDNQASGSAAVTAPPDGGVVLYAERSVTIGDHSQIAGGDTTVAKVAPPSFGPQLLVGVHVSVESNTNLIAPSVTLGQHDDVGNVQTNSLVNNGAARVGTVGTFPSSLPRMPLAPLPTPATNNVTVSDETTLPAGAYGTVTVTDTLRLQPGTYSFAALTLSDHARLLAEPGGVVVNIGGSMTVGEHTRIMPVTDNEDEGSDDQDDGPPAANLTITVSANDPSSTTSAAAIGDHSHIRALVLVPNGTFALGDHVMATGAFDAFDIHVGLFCDMTFQSGFPASASTQHGTQQLSGYLTPAIAAAPLVGPAPQAMQIALAISLPVQVPTGFPTLADFAQQVSDPSNPRYRQFLTPAQYAGYYQPSATSYSALQAFVQSYGLTIVSTRPDNEILDAMGTPAQIGAMIFANMNSYQRPDGTTFFAPDREPSLQLSVPVLSVAGIQNYRVPTPGVAGGTGPNMEMMGNDFRNAYLPSCESNLDGSGQTIGVVEFESFSVNDVVAYSANAKPPIADPTNLIYQVFYSASFSGNAPPTTGEAPLDVELVHAMAPAAKIIVYQAPTSSISYGIFGGVNFADDMLHDMAHPPAGFPTPYQNTSSWTNFNTDDDTAQNLQAMAALGESFFQSSGDGGAFTENPLDLRAYGNVTVVGGTNLSSAGGGTPPAETGWNGSGGGFLGPFSPIINGVSIPGYQTPFVTTANQASSMYRNFPDVSMPAAPNMTDYYATGGNPTPTDQATGGTSASTPLWAGFMALANEAATHAGVQTVGFANPVLYRIASPTGSLYGTCFNDIQGGSNPKNPSGNGAGLDDPNAPSPTGGFTAVAGYDLVTGLGSPTCTLITQLSSPTPWVPVPPPTPPGTTPPSFAGVAQNDTCGILSGDVECWGTNQDGEEANGNTSQQLTPVCGIETTRPGAAVLSVVAGLDHMCALFAQDHSVWCWGNNDYGQLGTGAVDSGGNPLTNSPTAIAVRGLPPNNQVSQIAAGGTTTCALLSGDNSVWCWGGNGAGVLGNGTQNTGPNPTPAQVPNLPAATQVAVSTGGAYACAVLANGGSVDCWGTGYLGDFNLDQHQGPTQAFQLSGATSVAVGTGHACAVVPQPPGSIPSSKVYCWGDNSASEIGEGDVNTGAFPMHEGIPVVATQVSGCTMACPPPVNVTQVTCGDDFTCVLVDDGSVECWGNNTFDQIGGTQSYPVPAPQTIGGLSGVSAIAAGPGRVCAQLSTGPISCWGEGPAGDGTTNNLSSPATVAFARCM
jgi:hypothetical protein